MRRTKWKDKRSPYSVTNAKGASIKFKEHFFASLAARARHRNRSLHALNYVGYGTEPFRNFPSFMPDCLEEGIIKILFSNPVQVHRTPPSLPPFPSIFLYINVVNPHPSLKALFTDRKVDKLSARGRNPISLLNFAKTRKKIINTRGRRKLLPSRRPPFLISSNFPRLRPNFP